MAVAAGDADHGAPRLDEDLHRDVDGGREAVRDEHGVASRNTAEMVERELLEP
jgi:hypothetical protein